MSEREKQLLLTDLCGRLPYNVKGRVFAETSKGDYDINGDMIFTDEPFVVVLDQVNIQTEEIRLTAVGNEETVEFIDNEQDFGEPYRIEDFKPYLRSLSSMTDEEDLEFLGIGLSVVNYGTNGNAKHKCKLSIPEIDWLNVHHFDYRGLIEKGLALEAPEGMYKINEKG